MPIWPVSFVDGSYQVADADGALYPLTMQGKPVTHFNEGWTLRGLQTGLAPFHVLEMEHDEGYDTFWLLDTSLDYRANAVVHLAAEDRALFDGHLHTLVRNLFEDAVRAPHAAIPAAAHEFDGLLPGSITELIRNSVPVVGSPETVSASALGELGSSYVGNGITLSTAAVGQALRTLVADGRSALSLASPRDGAMVASQERLDLPEHACFRFLDPASGLVFYLLAGAGEVDRHLYVPAASVVFVLDEADRRHDPLLMLLVYYASHTDRAVMLPEAEGLEPGLVHVVPPQAGLDEPVHVSTLHDPAPVLEPAPERAAEPGTARSAGSSQAEPVRSSQVGSDGSSGLHPLASSAAEPAGAHAGMSYRPDAGAGHDAATDIQGAPAPEAEPVSDYRVTPGTMAATDVPPDIAAAEAWPASGNTGTSGAAGRQPENKVAARTTVPRQNWWQRLLGLGNG